MFKVTFFCNYRFVLKFNENISTVLLLWASLHCSCYWSLMKTSKYEQNSLSASWISELSPPALHSAQCFQHPICKSSIVHFTVLHHCVCRYCDQSLTHASYLCETQCSDNKPGYKLCNIIVKFNLFINISSCIALLFFLVLLINALTFQYMKGSMRWKGKEERLVYLLSFIIAICRMQRKYI